MQNLKSIYLLAILIIVDFGDIDCATIKKTADLIAQPSLYQPSYQYSQPPEEHSSAYKKYSDDHDSYGKYAKDYGDSAYNHYGNQDQYLDHGYADHNLKKYNDYGSHDKYGGQSSHYDNKYKNGLYTRDRGYGYEKHYAYDKELATKNYAAQHADKSSNYGDHAKYDHSGLYSHGSSGHHKSGENKKYSSAGHNKYGHNSGAYGDHGKHYGSSGKTLHISTPYTQYSSPEYYEAPAPIPVYPSYKPEIYQQQYHDDPAVASSGHYEPTLQSSYISHAPSSSYPSASTSFASSAPSPLHHPGVAYY